MIHATTPPPAANWFDAAGRAIKNVTKPLNNKTTKRYEKAAITAANDWASLCIATANGEGEPSTEIITAVAAQIGVEPSAAVMTFHNDVKQARDGMRALKRAPQVQEKYAAALHGMSEDQFFKELKLEKEAIRKRKWEISQELHLISGRSQALAENKITIDRAAANTRIFPGGRKDIERAITPTTTDS